MSAPNERSASSTPSESPQLRSANINVGNSDHSSVNVNVTQPQQSNTNEAHNSTARDNGSKRPASPTDDDNPPKQQKDAPVGQNIPSSAFQHPANLPNAGYMHVTVEFNLRRTFGLQSQGIPDPPPHPISADPAGMRISERPKPTSVQTTECDMTIRVIQSSVIVDMGYTNLDMYPLSKYVVKLLSEKLNLLLDRDAQNF